MKTAVVRRLACLEKLIPPPTDLEREKRVAALVLLGQQELELMELIVVRPEPRTMTPDEAAAVARYESNLAAIERAQRHDGPRRATTAGQMIARGIQ